MGKENEKETNIQLYYFFEKKIIHFLRLLTPHSSVLSTISLLILISSCYTPTEGCLDIEATNFDASADEPCSDCCTYPQLQLKLFHSISAQGILQADTCINHSAATFLTNDSVNYFQLDDISFYLSDFELLMSNGDIAKVEDTITLSIYEDFVTQISKDTVVTDDFVLVRRSQFSYDLGEFRTSGTFSQLKFKVGITKRLNTTDVDTLAIAHPLSSSKEMHYGDRGAGFILQKIAVEKDTAESTTEIVDYEIGQVFVNAIQVELDFPKTFSPGFNVELPIKINYSKWLQGINFATDSEAEIKSKIVSNTADAFEIDD